MKPGKRPLGYEKRRIAGVHPLCLNVNPTAWASLSVAPSHPGGGPLPQANGHSQSPLLSLRPGPVAANGPWPHPWDLRKSQSLPPAAEAGGLGEKKRRVERQLGKGSAPSSRGGRGLRKEREAPRRAGGRARAGVSRRRQWR